MKKNEMFRILDHRLNKVVDDFWKEFPEANCGRSGSVTIGEWHISRSEHPHGIKFHLSDKQMNDLINDNQCIVKYNDMINQRKYNE